MNTLERYRQRATTNRFSDVVRARDVGFCRRGDERGDFFWRSLYRRSLLAGSVRYVEDAFVAT